METNFLRSLSSGFLRVARHTFERCNPSPPYNQLTLSPSPARALGALRDPFAVGCGRNRRSLSRQAFQAESRSGCQGPSRRHSNRSSAPASFRTRMPAGAARVPDGSVVNGGATAPLRHLALPQRELKPIERNGSRVLLSSFRRMAASPSLRCRVWQKGSDAWPGDSARHSSC
jgi:hypothetical protein